MVAQAWLSEVKDKGSQVVIYHRAAKNPEEEWRARDIGIVTNVDDDFIVLDPGGRDNPMLIKIQSIESASEFGSRKQVEEDSVD